MQTFLSKSSEETKKIAADFAAQLKGGDAVALLGDLGAGKTTFVQGLVASLGSSARVKSPTFAVVNEYAIDQPADLQRIIHIDFYRFTEAAQIRALELDGYKNKETIIVAEWPNIVDDLSFPATYTVRLTHTQDPQERLIDIR